MKKAIIHISDLHVTLHEDLKGNPLKNGINSWLTTDQEDKYSENYIADFCTYVKNKFNNYDLYLIISGDIANVSDEKEYEFAIKYIEKISTTLGIQKDKILIVPGDHDVNRRLCENAFRDGKKIHPTKKSYEYNEDKFYNFSSFYKTFYGNPFEVNNALVNYLDFQDEKLLVVGLNSNYHIDYESESLGAINTESLTEELKKLDSQYLSYSKVAMFHHNIYSNYDNTITGQWDKENRVTVLSILKQFNYKCLLYGNEHTRNSSKLGTNEQIYRSDCGSFSMKIPSPSFKIYDINKSEKKFSLNLKLFVLQNSNKIDEHKPGIWGIQNNQDLSEVEEIILFESSPLPISENNTLDNLTSQTEPLKIESKIISESYTNTFFSEKLFNIIKSKKLFHSGHFHWSEASRAHNWIDASKILNDKDDLLLAKNAIIDVIESCNLNDKFDFIIGLGIEGNILSTRASVKYDKPYSYLPYSYRYDEHNDYEKKLNFENKDEYKSVLIITDVVNDGRTLRKLIHKNKRAPEFFKDVKKIIVISLFYTGDSVSKSTDILNTKAGNFDEENDYLENRIEYYFVLDMKVEKCPYVTDYRNDCLIYKENLSCIHRFYDDEKALKKIIKKKLEK